MEESPKLAMEKRMSRFMLKKLESLAKPSGHLTYAEFIETALYDPELGYYSRSRGRVGKSAGTDFYTASSLGTLFGRLVVESAETLLDGQDPGDFIFLEFGAEPGTSVLDGVEHPFRDMRTLRLGDPLQVDGPAVVFANEWLDAQPFHRLVLENSIWREIGVSIAGGKLEEIRLEEISEGALPYLGNLPTDLPDGYHFDLPTGASEALRALAGQSWQGLFLTLDYGKSLAEMLETIPQGTARAYSNHKQSNDLLANPGEQDLTCHVCWDWLEKILADNGFEQVGNLRQEALFMRHAQTAIRYVLEDPDNVKGKGRLAELLHPAHLGLKFQALHGLRRQEVSSIIHID